MRVGVEQVCHKGKIEFLMATFHILSLRLSIVLKQSFRITLGVTNCLHPILSACFSMMSALSSGSVFCMAVLSTPESLGAIWWSRSV